MVEVVVLLMVAVVVVAAKKKSGWLAQLKDFSFLSSILQLFFSFLSPIFFPPIYRSI